MVVNLCDGKLHFAPLRNPQRILDVGTGTGIWAIDSESPVPLREKISHPFLNIYGMRLAAKATFNHADAH
jgi:ribosomal protein RSM22 (predicted rRNA methylase)